MEESGEKKKIENIEGAWAAIGFSLVLIIVGLPVWWLTTTVYRASLPYSTIEELAAITGYHTLHLSIVGQKSIHISDSLEQKFRSNDPYVRFLVSAYIPNKEQKGLLESDLSIEELEEKIYPKIGIHTGSFTIFIKNGKTERKTNNITIYVSNHRMMIIEENADIDLLAEILQEMTLDPLAKDGLIRRSGSLPNIKSKKSQIMRQIPTEPGYDITLTLMLPQPHRIHAQWNVKEAVEKYLYPLVNQLEGVMELKIRSQILYMTSMKISPKWSDKHQHFALPEQQLPLTINDIEAKLGSFVSTRPSLHFIIYIPTEHQTPLQIISKDGNLLLSNSFLIPRWGGVMIHNPPEDVLAAKQNTSTFPQTFSVDTHMALSTILSQLHKLFPIPTVKPREDIEFSKNIQESQLLTDWQLDGLARARVLAYLNSIKVTLRSLCDLVGEISNMVVSDDVAQWVWNAAQDWRACLDACREGRLKESTDYCKAAFVNSDAAFFHPSMLALLYFPDNQKYAIYVPLFLPVSIPVLLSLKMIFKLYKYYRSDKIKVE